MCGLLGFLSNDGTAKEVRDDLAAALDLARHRGPDEGATLHDEDTVLGFRRLSIIDLDSSHQPLPYDGGRYWLLFNGEIYNYLELRERLAREHGATFATEGDGEVILAAYKYLGEDCVRELRGMFAFLIWDTEARVLFGARDWFGIKPLFTMTDSRGTFWGSEKKSLLQLAQGAGGNGAELDTRSLQHYLTLQYVPEPATLHRGIRRIESGTSFTVADGELTTTRYFHPTFPIRPVARDEQQALYDRIAEVLDDSVRVHMRADVTVGSFLSGGIDSTAIAALAKRYNPKLMTFTTGFERQGFSEIDVAAESAAAIGVEHGRPEVAVRLLGGDDPTLGAVHSAIGAGFEESDDVGSADAPYLRDRVVSGLIRLVGAYESGEPLGGGSHQPNDAVKIGRASCRERV